MVLDPAMIVLCLELLVLLRETCYIWISFAAHILDLRRQLRVIKYYVHAVSLALLDRAVHKAQLLGVVALDGITTGSERDER